MTLEEKQTLTKLCGLVIQCRSQWYKNLYGLSDPSKKLAEEIKLTEDYVNNGIGEPYPILRSILLNELVGEIENIEITSTLKYAGMFFTTSFTKPFSEAPSCILHLIFGYCELSDLCGYSRFTKVFQNPRLSSVCRAQALQIHVHAFSYGESLKTYLTEKCAGKSDTHSILLEIVKLNPHTIKGLLSTMKKQELAQLLNLSQKRITILDQCTDEFPAAQFFNVIIQAHEKQADLTTSERRKQSSEKSIQNKRYTMSRLESNHCLDLPSFRTNNSFGDYTTRREYIIELYQDAMGCLDKSWIHISEYMIPRYIKCGV